MHVHANLIGGEWVKGPGVIRNINPANTDEVLGEYSSADAAQTEQAIAAARVAFPAWSMSGIQQRFDVLDRIGSEILTRKEELGALLSREEGKTLTEAIGEVARAGSVFKFFAGDALRLGGETIPSVRNSIQVEVSREPVGVVGLITPWNFPIAIPAWKTAPALAYGNCVVIKPAELTPGVAWEMADIIARAGLPDGVFNLVVGRGSVVGETLVNSTDVDAISFTGSVPVGRHVLAEAAKRGARVQLEMGSKNALIVLDDADLAVAVECAINGAFYSTGQRCTASSRLIVTKGIHDQFVARMQERMRTLNVDDPLKTDTHIGPVVDQRQLEQDLRYLEIGKKEGATLVEGGELLEREHRGFFLSPALFVDSRNDMRINREEIFGPIAGVIRVHDYEEALETANDTSFGLTAGICTQSLKYASHFKRHIQAGLAMVNLPTAGVDYHVPFGGRKASSYGPREQGSYAREFYTVVKTAYIAS
ncbi:MAG: aldehyde dehydrogenase family protein [Rhodoplanes sp.]